MLTHLVIRIILNTIKPPCCSTLIKTFTFWSLKQSLIKNYCLFRSKDFVKSNKSISEGQFKTTLLVQERGKKFILVKNLLNQKEI